MCPFIGMVLENINDGHENGAPYLAEKRAEVDRQTRELADVEAELNDRVFALFHLTKPQIQLLHREVEH